MVLLPELGQLHLVQSQRLKLRALEVSSGSDATIVSIANTYTSTKVLVNITPDINKTNLYEMVELNVINDGTTIDLLEFGRLTAEGVTAASSSGLGTYSVMMVLI